MKAIIRIADKLRQRYAGREKPRLYKVNLIIYVKDLFKKSSKYGDMEFR
jgi:hypothetical protein